MVVQWGGSHVYKVGPKVFAMWSFASDPPKSGFIFKTTDLTFEILLEAGLGHRAPHFQRNWVQISSFDALTDEDLSHYVLESHRMVVKSLTRRCRLSLGLEIDIQGS
jgi:predicted DNA-binding protein (MmcQ/YjbR family)